MYRERGPGQVLRTSSEARSLPLDEMAPLRSEPQRRARGGGGGAGRPAEEPRGKALSPALRRPKVQRKHFVLQCLFLWVTVFFFLVCGD